MGHILLHSIAILGFLYGLDIFQQSMSSIEVPISRPFWGKKESENLNQVLESGIWTNGPMVQQFEEVLACEFGEAHVTCVSSGSAAIELLLYVLRRQATNPLLVSSVLNFVAGAAIGQRYGYRLALTDIEDTTLNMCPRSLERVLESHSTHDLVIVMPTHFAGQYANMEAITSIVNSKRGYVIEDACHALPTAHSGRTTADSRKSTLATVLSFHPNKPIASGEGGAIVTHHEQLANQMRQLRNHNMDHYPLTNSNGQERDGEKKPWFYDVAFPGYNFRMSEFNAAIGLAQTERLEDTHRRRRELAIRYNSALKPLKGAFRFLPSDDFLHGSVHIYPISFDLARLGITKSTIFKCATDNGVGLQVHYTPIDHFSFFQETKLSHPVMDSIAPGLVSLPLFPSMSRGQADLVLHTITQLVESGGCLE